MLAGSATKRLAIFPSTTHGFCRIEPSATIATSPGLTIGVPVSMPYEPILLVVMVPSSGAGGDSYWASVMLGAMSPRGIAAAIPRFT